MASDEGAEGAIRRVLVALERAGVPYVAGIVRTQGTDIDVAYVERWVAVLGLQREWERASAEAGVTR